MTEKRNALPARGLRIGVDTGGTFTDICLYDPASGTLQVWKISSSNADPSEAIVAGIREVLQVSGQPAGDVAYVGHGTTVATNALIEGRTARTALLTTAGFRDVVEIGRQTRPTLYDLQVRKVTPLASRDLRLELDERVRFDGSVAKALNPRQVLERVAQLEAAGVEAVAVGFLFSHLAPEHEATVAKILEERLPNVFVSTSHQVAAEYREFERFSTTLVNAALGPVMRDYLGRLQPRLAALGVAAAPRLTQSNGGIISASHAAQYPVKTVLSGPAAGVMGAVEVSRAAGIGDIITFDMGGTSSDVSLTRNGAASLSTRASVHGHPLKVPQLDIHAVGAGGGSIARVDAGGLLKVGPASAGAWPGPVCYGQGNLEPTVTDANVVLQVLNPTHLLGGRMPINRGQAIEAIDRLAQSLGMDLFETAQGILSVVTANMAKAIRVISIERGHDPRDFVLMAFGGAGPLHAARLARELEIRRVLVPRNPGILCAMGLLLSDARTHFAKGCLLRLDEAGGAALEQGFDGLEQQASDWFEQEAIAVEARQVKRFVDARYAGQAHELLIESPPGPIAADWLARVRQAFELEHRQIYGFDAANEPIHVIAMRVEATGKVDKAVLVEQPLASGDVAEARVGQREVWYPQVRGFVATPIYDRERLGAGHSLNGPAIIEQMDSTTLVLEGQRATVDRYLNILIEEQGE
ncbi:hydantoinase/oxoprolinase family protein [Pseudomonas sp. 5P_5.1_Bac1]|uniref:hydantoinase/oxoprolinase family protein n=1 Tax=Pseudomonas sp. 5P_5.1_Bac1 TaxID=2971616 RepID=UPI0021C5BD0C|nr:hydantoinase/oxoprolinase family protein [Pseudomonas sp. 5P_5.1_Bac1]MCU1722653.1 hydantoinase/oxoprolinase family protein [Pseudomonas sp. 5P_5.1_Bac1]